MINGLMLPLDLTGDFGDYGDYYFTYIYFTALDLRYKIRLSNHNHYTYPPKNKIPTILKIPG